MNSPLVSIIILNWNGQRYLEACLNSLWAQTFREFEIVLVDNGSTDGSVEFIRTRFAGWLEGQAPVLKLIELAQNEGFSGGNLAGLRHCNPSSRYIATLNNDTEAETNWLARLVEALEATRNYGAACGPMLFASERAAAYPRLASAGIEVRRDGLAIDRQLGQPWQPGGQPLEIFGPCAGAALYRRKALDEVGFFDPAFFAYLEDADLAWRLRLAGWPTLYLPEAKVWHEYSGTGGQGSPFKSFQLGRNRLWVILKNWPGALLWRHGWRIIGYDLLACAYTLFKGNPHSTRGRLAALHPRHWRRIREQRRLIQARRVATLAELERWLRQPATPAETVRQQKTANELAATQL